jgi:Uma2 family endonuclease
MATETKTSETVENLAELLERLGDVPLERIRMRPPPGTATEQDVITTWTGPNRRLCELVDGVLVEKAMGTKEAGLALFLGGRLLEYGERNDIGTALGADGMLRLFPGLVRIPDVSFFTWQRLPNEDIPSDEAIAAIVPDLAVEILSRNNTKKEIQRKLRDYFLAGTQLVWVIQPKTQTAQVYTSPTTGRRIGKDGRLDGGTVVPGFTLSLRELFAPPRQRGKKTA